MCPDLKRLTIRPVSVHYEVPWAKNFKASEADIVPNLVFFEGLTKTATAVVLRRPIRELVLIDEVINEEQIQVIST